VSDPTISVIVPVYRGGEPFDLCLSSLQRLAPGPHETLVVVDGGCGDSAARAARAGFRVVAFDERHGPAAARNRGAAEATGDILFFLDADVLVPSGACAHVARAFATGEQAALIGSYDNRPAAANFLSQYKNLVHRFTHQCADPDAFTFWGACGAIRRNVFLALGGFDELYREASIEDIELGYRLRRKGYRISLDRTLEVTHLKRWTVASLLLSDVVRRAVPWSELILRERRLENDLNLRVGQRVAVALTWLVLALLAGAPWVASFLPAAAVTAFLLLLLDLPLWRYLWRERGTWFVARSLPWQWLSYAYSGGAFAWVCARHVWSWRRARAMEPA
jgi:GT2 family glycosyltransferase